MPTQDELRALWESATPAQAVAPTISQDELRSLWESAAPTAQMPTSVPTQAPTPEPSPLAAGMDGLGQFQEAYQPLAQPPEMADVPTDVSLAQQPSVAEKDRGIGAQILGLGETALTIGTGAVGGAAGLIGGAMEGLYEAVTGGAYGTPEGADLVQKRAMDRSEQFTYAPRTEAGAEYLREVGEFLAPLEALGPATPASRVRHVVKARVRRDQDPVDKGADPLDVPPSDDPIVPGPQVEPISQKDLAKYSRKVAEGGLGSNKAKRIIAEQAMIDPDVDAAAQRIGVRNYLQDDHLTSNQQFRELSQAVKSVPGSEARQMEIDGLARAADRVDNIMLEMGASDDWSQLSSNVKRSLEKEQNTLLKQTEDLYSQLEKNIDPRSSVSTDNISAYLSDRISKVGLENLTPSQRKIYNRITPKEGKPISYALLDQTRKELTAARVKNQGVFKDSDTGDLKKLENELLKDQKIAADKAGQLDLFNNARRTVATRKSLEDDMKSLFGKKLDENFLSKLQAGFTGLSKGDASKLNKILDAVPESIRQNVVASGLNTAFAKNLRSGNLNWNSFSDWYRKASRNREAFNTIMNNLPKDARRQLNDIYKVSESISKASKERIATGRIQSVKADLDELDGVIANMYSLAKRSAGGMAIDAMFTIAGTPSAYGTAAAVSSALTRGKPNTTKAVDRLLVSPQFREFVRNRDANKLSRSGPFKAFVKSTGSVMKDPELWLLEAMRQNEDREDIVMR